MRSTWLAKSIRRARVCQGTLGSRVLGSGKPSSARPWTRNGSASGGGWRSRGCSDEDAFPDDFHSDEIPYVPLSIGPETGEDNRDIYRAGEEPKAFRNIVTKLPALS